MDNTRKSERIATKVEKTSLPPISTFTDPIPPPPVKKKAKTASERNKEYRARIKADPEKASAFREKNRQRSTAYRQNATPEQKKHMADQSSIRMQNHRNKKAKENKPSTRKTEQEKLAATAKATELKRIWRASRTPQKKMWDNKKRREKRALEKTKRQAAQQSEISTQTFPVDHEAENSAVSGALTVSSSLFSSPPAKRKRLERARKSLPADPEKYAETVASLHEKASPRKKKALEKRGFGDQYRKIGLVFMHSFQALRGKKDSESRSARRALLSMYKECRSLKKTSALLGIDKRTVIRYLKPTLSKKKEASVSMEEKVASFLKSKATPLSDKKSVSKKTGESAAFLKKRVEDYHKEFLATGQHTSFSRFAKCRPKCVRRMGAKQLNQCLCEYCANVELKLEVVNRHCTPPQKIRHVYHAVQLSTCQNGGKACAYRECPDCDIHKLENHLAPLRTHTGQLSWHRWTTKKVRSNGREMTRKVLEVRNGSMSDLLNELLQEVAFLSEHLFRATWQHQQYEAIRTSTPFPSDLILMVMDFAENYSCSYQDEVQAAHWNYESVTLHPIAVNYRCSNCEESVYESLIFVSEDTNHDFHAVNKFFCVAISHLRQTRGLNPSRLYQWSDGCAAQYKSRGPFADVAASPKDFGLTVERNFFGSRHGKGPCDGEAAVVKHHATSAVKAKTAFISTAREFFEYGMSSSLNKQPFEDGSCRHFLRTFFWVPEGGINRQRPHRQVKTVKGTRNFHHVKPGSTEGVLHTRHLTCVCQPCLSSHHEGCLNLNTVGPWKEHMLVPATHAGSLPPAADDGGPLPPTADDCGPLPPAADDGGPLPPTADGDGGPLPPAADGDGGPLPPAADGDGGPLPPPDGDNGPLPPTDGDGGPLPPTADGDGGPLPPTADVDGGPLPPADGDGGPLPPTAENEPSSQESLRKGSWVKVGFAVRKRIEYFIGKVVQMDGDDIEVNFLKCRGEHYTWPDKEDLSYVSRSQIIQQLGHPDISARGQYKFN